MKIEARPYLPLDYDSSRSSNEILEPYESVVRQLKAAVGSEFTFKMKPSGAIEGIKIADETLKRLKEGLEQGERDSFSEQALKDQVSQTSPDPFPQEALEPGKSWSAKTIRLPMPTGTLVLDRSFTFQGSDPKNPKVMLIAMEGRVALEPARGIGQDPCPGREGKRGLRHRGRSPGREPRYPENRNGRRRRGSGARRDHRNELGDDHRALMRPVRAATPHTMPCFLILLKNVLRGMPSTRAATLLLPPASFSASSSRCRS